MLLSNLLELLGQGLTNRNVPHHRPTRPSCFVTWLADTEMRRRGFTKLGPMTGRPAESDPGRRANLINFETSDSGHPLRWERLGATLARGLHAVREGVVAEVESTMWSLFALSCVAQTVDSNSFRDCRRPWREGTSRQSEWLLLLEVPLYC